jgi:pimeloyl-ACP methyl ester carboxylesterase
MQTRRIPVNDVELVVAEDGIGGRPLLLAHGFTGAKEDFTDYLALLAVLGWHVVAPDQRGHGDSAKPEGRASYSLDIYADDLLALADALGWDRFALLGHSMGGMIAQVAATKAASRLTGLVLMDTSHGPLEGFDESTMGAAKHIVETRGLPALVEAMRDAGPSPLQTAADMRLCEERPGYKAWGEQKTMNVAPDMWISMIEELFGGADRIDSLANLKVPTLVIVGEQDRGFVGPSERMAKTIPGAQLAVIPDAGHSPQFEAPTPWWTALSSFLDSLPVA